MTSKEKRIFVAGQVWAISTLIESGNEGAAEELYKESGMTINDIVDCGSDYDLKIIEKYFRNTMPEHEYEEQIDYAYIEDCNPHLSQK